MIWKVDLTKLMIRVFADSLMRMQMAIVIMVMVNKN